MAWGTGRLLGLALVALAIAAFAPEARAYGWAPHFEPRASLESQTFPIPVENGVNQQLTSVDFFPEVELTPRKSIRLALVPELHADPWNTSPQERYWVELPQGDLRYHAHGWAIQAGYDVYTWGVTDGFNPLDAVSAARYEDPLSPRKLGAPSLLVRKSLGTQGQFSAEGILIPWQRQSILPGQNSRWLPREIFETHSVGSGAESAAILLPPEVSYSYASSEELDGALSMNAGARVQAQSIAPGLDLSLEVFDGAAPVPAVDLGLTGTIVQLLPSIVIQAQPGIVLTPVYYRQLVYGGSLVYAAGGVILRAEAMATRVTSKRSDLPGDSQQFVAGLERTFPIGPEGLTALLQASYCQHTDPLENSPAALDRIFDRALMLGGRYRFSERTDATLWGLYDTESHSELATAQAGYRFNDILRASLRVDGIWGPQGTPLGTFSANDRVTLELDATL